MRRLPNQFTMGLFSRKKKEPALPNNLFDRVGVSAGSICMALRQCKLVPSGNLEPYMWESICYILSTLYTADVITSLTARRIYTKMSNLYPEDSTQRKECSRWMMCGFSFYNKEVYALANGEHTLPDVIIYNLSHPVITGRKVFEELPLTLDFFRMQTAWSMIANIMGNYFFRKDESIAELPLGI